MSNAVQQISDMMFRYAELFDTGQFDEFAALFEHGQWHKAEPGAAAARQWITNNVRLYDGLTRTKHVTTNVIIDVDEDAGTATATRLRHHLPGPPGLPAATDLLRPLLRTGWPGRPAGGTGPNVGCSAICTATSPVTSATHQGAADEDAGAGRHRVRRAPPGRGSDGRQAPA